MKGTYKSLTIQFVYFCLFDRMPITDSTSKQLQNLVRIAEDAIIDKGDSHCHSFRFYVDTKANPPVPSWVHPLGPPTNPVSAAAPPKASSPVTANPGEPENPDKRPLPKGWMQQYDTTWVSFSSRYSSVLTIHDSHKAFFYVDTTALHPTPSWTHPLGPAPPTTSLSPAPARVQVVSPPPSQSAVPGEPENPDKRPLPTGWIAQYDARYVYSTLNLSFTDRCTF